jgi:hypothetical protein
MTRPGVFNVAERSSGEAFSGVKTMNVSKWERRAARALSRISDPANRAALRDKFECIAETQRRVCGMPANVAAEFAFEQMLVEMDWMQET